MANVDSITVTVPEPLATHVRAAVEAGDYGSTGDAIRDAVRLWAEHREPGLERLRQAWDAGEASGMYGVVDLDDLRREARSRLTAAREAEGHAG